METGGPAAHKRAGVKKPDWPAAPAPHPAYPGKADQVLELIEEFRQHPPGVVVKAVVADALYGTQRFLDEASRQCGEVQAISQLRSHQKVRFRGREWSLAEYFRAYPGVPMRLCVRGGEEIEAEVSSARLHVCAHGKKRFVVALKYPGETDDSFLVATDLSWRTLDIARTYTLRWLAEVFSRTGSSTQDGGKWPNSQTKRGQAEA